LLEVRVNCEQNSLLYVVRPRRGGICHTKNEADEPRNYFYCQPDCATHTGEDAEADPTAPPPIQPTLAHAPYTPHASLFASPPSLLPKTSSDRAKSGLGHHFLEKPLLITLLSLMLWQVEQKRRVCVHSESKEGSDQLRQGVHLCQ
jgi:hypothetical protein